VEEGNARAVQATYARLFEEHGPPLVLKSDNGGPFRDHETKELLAEYDVVPLYNPRRRPAYNGGVERANGQLAGYQEALAEYHGRAGLPTCADAEEARQLANELNHPAGWRAPTAVQLWAERQPITASEPASWPTCVSSGWSLGLRYIYPQTHLWATTQLRRSTVAPSAMYSLRKACSR